MFSKIPNESYISVEQLEEIIQNFSYELPAESVYKITGVRVLVFQPVLWEKVVELV